MKSIYVRYGHKLKAVKGKEYQVVTQKIIDEIPAPFSNLWPKKEGEILDDGVGWWSYFQLHGAPKNNFTSVKWIQERI